jgi:succinyl-CoA synthetase alpha subunit
MLNRLNRDTSVIVQGITGKEGERVTEFMQKAGVKVVGGVRPGKGGEEVLGVPVYDSVKEAVKKNPEALVSCVYVPPEHVLAAAREALSGGVKLLHIIGEGVPVRDAAMILDEAARVGAKVLGPASLGMIVPGEFKLGSLGGEDNSSFTAGDVGVVSRSGGMSSELSYILTKAKLGQSMVVHVGGDFLVGYSPAEVLEAFEMNARTKRVLMVGEVGGGYEREVVELIRNGGFSKPLVAFIGGAFVESLPQQVPLGHAGAIIQGEGDTRGAKIEMLKSVGVKVAERLDEVVGLLG